MSRYAVNVCDLSSAMAGFTGYLFADFATKDSPTVRVNKSLLDTTAVVLDGTAAQDAERVETLIVLLQTVIGPRRMGRRVRCYREGPRGGWQEIRPKERQTSKKLNLTAC